ncbi:hypothetical protein E0H62_15900 [Rhizobium leguminosarum bv. viciae]|nr:hypothetical protein E0H62_15900 [Rhizobium leguminosarum bv. viciae]
MATAGSNSPASSSRPTSQITKSRRASVARSLERNVVVHYITVIGVAGERSKGVFATAEIARLLLTTDVLALV